MLPVLAEMNPVEVIGDVSFLVAIVAGVVIACRIVLRRLRARSIRFGFSGVLQYLRAIPKGEAQRADAIELAVRGGAICLLAAVFPLLVLVGVLPLYYGARKLLYMHFGPQAAPPQSGE